MIKEMTIRCGPFRTTLGYLVVGDLLELLSPKACAQAL